MSLCDPALGNGQGMLISSSAVMASDNIELSYVYDPRCSHEVFRLDQHSLTDEEVSRLSDALYRTSERNAETGLSEVMFAFTGTVRRDGEDRYITVRTLGNVTHRLQASSPANFGQIDEQPHP